MKECLHCAATVLVLGLISLTSCRVEPPAEQPADSPSQQSQATSPVKEERPSQSTVPYEVVRRWKPNNEVRGLGAEIVVSAYVNQQELIDLCKWLDSQFDPVSLNAYTSREAYQDAKSDYGAAAKSGHIFMYVKNLTGRGLFGGFNEIRWMQEKGRFQGKLGTVTKIQ